MERQDIIKKRIVQVRTVIYALIIILSFLVILLFGIYSVVRIGFIAVFFAVNIFKGVKTIRNSSYSESIFKEILNAVKVPLIAGLVMMFTFYPMSSIDGKLPFQYSFSKMYTNKYNGYSNQLLPEKIPGDISDYHFSYFPGFMQADSMLEVSFSTSADELGKIEKSAEERAVGVLDLEKYRHYNIMEQSGDEEVTAFKKSYFKADENGYTADHFAPRTGLAGENDGAGKMYIIESNGNWNHPHTVCITVNYETCTVSYTC